MTLPSEIRKAFNASIGKTVAGSGYKRCGTVWLKQRPHLTSGVWLERHTLCESYHLCLGVWLTAVDKYNPRKNEPDCDIQIFFDKLLSGDDRGEFLRRCDFTGKDYTYTDEEKIELICKYLRDYGLPLLDRLSSAEPIQEALLRGELDGSPAIITLAARKKLSAFVAKSGDSSEDDAGASPGR